MPSLVPLADEPQFVDRVQVATDEAMAAQPGALVVVDINSRKILAAHRLDLATRLRVRPGSTLKPFVLMALLESGKLDPAQHFVCRGQLQIGSVRMDCSHPAAITQLTAEDAIAYSCNSYLAEVGPRLNAGELVQVFRRAGFDSPTGLAPNEAVGHIGRPSNREELQLEVLGDRGIEVTPLELLEAYRKLGQRRRAGELGPDESVFTGLEDSVTFGMAHAANLEGVKIAGKTGTAASPGTAATHGFFVGYAPAGKPRIALVVYLETGRGMDAAALARPVVVELARGWPEK
jgi:penicillin-binding protein 2